MDWRIQNLHYQAGEAKAKEFGPMMRHQFSLGIDTMLEQNSPTAHPTDVLAPLKLEECECEERR
jgi:hypothetical protein